MITTRYKILMLLPAFLFAWHTTIAQTVDTTKPTRAKITGVYITASAVYSQFSSADFMNYIVYASKASYNLFIVYNDGYSYIVQDNTTPQTQQYTQNSISAGFSAGFQFSDYSKNGFTLNQAVDISYAALGGAYNYNFNYLEESAGYYYIPNYNVYDTTHGTYRSNTVSLNYKVQPTYKFVFVSLGIGAALNILSYDENKTEWKRYDNPYYGTYYPDSTKSRELKKNIFDVTFPVQLGFGFRFTVHKIDIVPSFYFTRTFDPFNNIYFNNPYSLTYNTYNVSLQFVYKLD